MEFTITKLDGSQRICDAFIYVHEQDDASISVTATNDYSNMFLLFYINKIHEEVYADPRRIHQIYTIAEYFRYSKVPKIVKYLLTAFSTFFNRQTHFNKFDIIEGLMKADSISARCAVTNSLLLDNYNATFINSGNDDYEINVNNLFDPAEFLRNYTGDTDTPFRYLWYSMLLILGENTVMREHKYSIQILLPSGDVINYENEEDIFELHTRNYSIVDHKLLIHHIPDNRAVDLGTIDVQTNVDYGDTYFDRFLNCYRNHRHVRCRDLTFQELYPLDRMIIDINYNNQL